MVGKPGADGGRVLVADQVPGQLLPAQPPGREQAGDLLQGRALGTPARGGEAGQVDPGRVAIVGDRSDAYQRCLRSGNRQVAADRRQVSGH